jgi:hypothetical protein
MGFLILIVLCTQKAHKFLIWCDRPPVRPHNELRSNRRDPEKHLSTKLLKVYQLYCINTLTRIETSKQTQTFHSQKVDICNLPLPSILHLFTPITWLFLAKNPTHTRCPNPLGNLPVQERNFTNSVRPVRPGGYHRSNQWCWCGLTGLPDSQIGRL